MEIYTNSKAVDRTVFLEFPETPDSLDVEVRSGNDVLHVFSTASVVTDGLSVTIPFHLVQHDADLKVHWSIVYTEDNFAHEINRTTPVEVVTPILTKAEIRAIDPNVFADDSEVVRIERAVRHVIQAYTGQKFGHWHGTTTVKGDGTPALYSPTKIIELTGVSGNAPITGWALDPDGHIVYRFPWGVPPVKADYHNLHYHTGGVIHNPNHVSLSQWAKGTYELTGRFGWEEVPAGVKEAAKLLVNDYACADSQYRDRYLESMTAADWRIQFNSGAFKATGNVRADQLLGEFVVTRRGWGVI